jgi:hypothetical protein
MKSSRNIKTKNVENEDTLPKLKGAIEIKNISNDQKKVTKKDEPKAKPTEAEQKKKGKLIV